MTFAFAQLNATLSISIAVTLAKLQLPFQSTEIIQRSLAKGRRIPTSSAHRTKNELLAYNLIKLAKEQSGKKTTTKEGYYEIAVDLAKYSPYPRLAIKPAIKEVVTTQELNTEGESHENEDASGGSDESHENGDATGGSDESSENEDATGGSGESSENEDATGGSGESHENGTLQPIGKPPTTVFNMLIKRPSGT